MLTIKNVSKRIKDQVILNDVSMNLTAGKIHAIVGKNGSGKTMLLRAISGLINIDEGFIQHNKLVLHRDVDVLPSLGLTLENAGLYPEYTGYKNLELLAGIKRKASKEDIVKAIERVGLDPYDRRTVRKYSLGMKQRITIAQAIMEKPDILLLDEPSNSLDDDGILLIREIIREEAKRGAIILIATHDKEEIEHLADLVFYIHAGSLREMESRHEAIQNEP